MKIPIPFSSPYIGGRFLFFSALPILDEDSYSFLPFLYWMKIPLRRYLISPCDECIIRSILHLIVTEEPTCTICTADRSSQLSTASPFALPCLVCVDLDVGPCIPASVSAMLPGQCLQNAPLALLPSHPVEVLRCRLLFCHRYLHSFHCTVLTFGHCHDCSKFLICLLIGLHQNLHHNPQKLSSPAC